MAVGKSIERGQPGGSHWELPRTFFTIDRVIIYFIIIIGFCCGACLSLLVFWWVYDDGYVIYIYI